MSRLQECLKVMRDLKDLGFPEDYEPLKEISRRMSDYIKTGDPWAGKVKFEAYKRVAEIILPRKEGVPITLVLKKTK